MKFTFCLLRQAAVDQEDGAHQVLGGQAAGLVGTEEDPITGVSGPSEP